MTQANAARQAAEQAQATAAQARAAADQARAAADEARAAAREGQAVNDADVPDPASPPDVPLIFNGINFGDGQPAISANLVDGNIVLKQEGHTATIPWRDAVPSGVVSIVWAIPATLSILLIWWPISRAVIRWLNRKNVSNNETAALEARLRDRFETLERNLDTVAVEMERLSEGQRFTNRLLAERGEQIPVNGQR